METIAFDLRQMQRTPLAPEHVAAIRAAVDGKPQGHDFHIERGAPPALARHMSVLGG